MKKPCEIKKDIIECMDEAIVVSETGDAHDFSDFADKAHVCMSATLTYIQQLEQELAAVKRERDAAVSDCSEFPCRTCDDKENQDLCCNYIKTGSTRRTNHVWRGVCPDNAEVQTDD